jgi:16S rRNA (uracil1498-N3)-methyltransferase
MRKFFVGNDSVISGENIIVSGETAHHILHVLRLKHGEHLTFGNLQGIDYDCSLESIEKKNGTVTFAIKSYQEQDFELPYKVILYQGIPQGSGKLDEIIQKCVELGVFKVIPVYTAYSFLKSDGTVSKLKRYQRIAEMAAGQSRRSIIPTITPPLAFHEALSMRVSESIWLTASEHERQTSIRLAVGTVSPCNIGIWIGPEGGFSSDELLALERTEAVPITLGRRILRTETAGPTALAQLQSVWKAETF